MAVWPSKFCPVINSFQESPPGNTIRSQMDRGPAKVRRRTTANVRRVSFNLIVTKAEVQEIDDFYVDDTFSGSSEFDFTHPRTGQGVKARFTAPPDYKNRSTMYEVAISLEILP